MRTEHEVDLREHLRQLQQQVRMEEERRQRQTVRRLVDRVVRAENHLFAPRRAQSRPARLQRLQAVHLAVARDDDVRGEVRVARDVHRPRRLVGDEVAPGEDDVGEERRLFLVREDESAVAVVEEDNERALRKPLSRPVWESLVLVDDGREDQIRLEAFRALRLGIVQPPHCARISRLQRVHGLLQRLAQERLNASPRVTRGATAMNGSKRGSSRIARKTLSPENIDASHIRNATLSRSPRASLSRHAAACAA